MADATLNVTNTVQEFYSHLKNFIAKKVSNPHIAEDLTQEVMYRLAKANGEDKEIRNVKVWLFQTARHVIADYYRDNYRNPIAKTQSEFPTLQSEEGEMAILPEVDFLIPMIKLLPDKYSRPLLMSDIQDIPQKEIAKRMDLGLSATKMRVQRGRKKLRALFTSCCDIEFDANGDFARCTIKDHCEPLLELRKELCKDNPTHSKSCGTTH